MASNNRTSRATEILGFTLSIFAIVDHKTQKNFRYMKYFLLSGLLDSVQKMQKR